MVSFQYCNIFQLFECIAHMREQHHTSKIFTFQERQEMISIYTTFPHNFNVVGALWLPFLKVLVRLF